MMLKSSIHILAASLPRF